MEKQKFNGIPQEKISAENLLREIKPLLKDLFVAIIRKSSDGLTMTFPNGQKFTVAVWEESKGDKTRCAERTPIA